MTEGPGLDSGCPSYAHAVERAAALLKGHPFYRLDVGNLDEYVRGVTNALAVVYAIPAGMVLNDVEERVQADAAAEGARAAVATVLARRSVLVEDDVLDEVIRAARAVD